MKSKVKNIISGDVKEKTENLGQLESVSTLFANIKPKNPVEYEKMLKQEKRNLEIAVAVRTLRQEMNLSQREFAVMIGKPQSTIGRIETGKSKPSMTTLEEIASKTGKQISVRFV